MGRRGENIHKRKDGRWEARVICRYSAEGKAVYRSLYGKTYQDVKCKRNELVAKLGTIGRISEQSDKLKITFEALAQEWLNYRKGSVKESTYANYINIYENHLRQKLGGMYLISLTTDVIDMFLKEKLERGRKDGKGGLSPKTVADIRSVISMVLEYAKSRNYPCQVDNKIFYPTGISKNISVVLSRSEQVKLEESAFHSSDNESLGILLALYCGLRIGEICALQWKDVNFDDGMLSVSKTILRIRDLSPNAAHKTKVIIERPKTISSIRIVPIPTFLLRRLNDFHGRPDCYVLTGTSSFIEPRMYLDKYKTMLKESGLGDFSFHALRHTFATRCVENGFDIKSLSEILGHSNVRTTLQRYVHPSMESKRQQMERLADICILGQNYGRDCT